MTNLEQYHLALEAGNTQEATRLANLIDWMAEVPALPPRKINTTAADNASKRCGFDYEGAILARDERMITRLFYS